MPDQTAPQSYPETTPLPDLLERRARLEAELAERKARPRRRRVSAWIIEDVRNDIGVIDRELERRGVSADDGKTQATSRD